MPLGLYPPKVITHRENGLWTATLYIEGKWHAQLGGFQTAAAASRAIRQMYLGG